MNNKIATPEFWVSNVCDKNVTLADLAINIRSFTTVNLLDKKHYSFTLEQLQKSKVSGSLFMKRDKIMIRNLKPNRNDNNLVLSSDNFIPSRSHSILEVNTKEYEDLYPSGEDKNKADEIYAQENADLAQLDEERVFIGGK